ncbi:MAG: STAS domain-containing protein [Armatimonadetes bacterium]|nr:STAS domain-containing protein [Armatimonadota bacterium]
MDFQVEKCGNLCIVRIIGDFDYYHAPEFRCVVQDLVDEGFSQIIVAMEDVTFMDSSGMSALIFSARRVSKTGGRFSIAGCSPCTYRKLEIGGLTTIPALLSFFPTVQDARQSMTR